jgi:hypothetical protein
MLDRRPARLAGAVDPLPAPPDLRPRRAGNRRRRQARPASRARWRPSTILVCTSARPSIGEKRKLCCQHARASSSPTGTTTTGYGPDRLGEKLRPLIARHADVTALRDGVVRPASVALRRPGPELHRCIFFANVHGGTFIYRRALRERGPRYRKLLDRGGRLLPGGAAAARRPSGGPAGSGALRIRPSRGERMAPAGRLCGASGLRGDGGAPRPDSTSAICAAALARHDRCPRSHHGQLQRHGDPVTGGVRPVSEPAGLSEAGQEQAMHRWVVLRPHRQDGAALSRDRPQGGVAAPHGAAVTCPIPHCGMGPGWLAVRGPIGGDDRARAAGDGNRGAGVAATGAVGR